MSTVTQSERSPQPRRADYANMLRERAGPTYIGILHASAADEAGGDPDAALRQIALSAGQASTYATVIGNGSRAGATGGVPASSALSSQVTVMVPAMAGSLETKSTACTSRTAGTKSTKRASTMSESAVVLPRAVEASAYVSASRYDPPGRASNRWNLPLILSGGSHAVSASRSMRPAYTVSGGAAMSREAVSVGTIVPAYLYVGDTG
jgi:hypothetical protein